MQIQCGPVVSVSDVVVSHALKLPINIPVIYFFVPLP